MLLMNTNSKSKLVLICSKCKEHTDIAWGFNGDLDIKMTPNSSIEFSCVCGNSLSLMLEDITVISNRDSTIDGLLND